MVDLTTAMRVIRGSKRYEFDGTVLTITDYYDSRNKVVLDLSFLTEDMLRELSPDDSKMAIVYNEEDDVWEVWNDSGDDMWHYFDSREDAMDWCEENDYEYELM